MRPLDPVRAITQYSIQVWDIEGGLPSNSVLAIRQTRDGYLWIGTQDGLVRFDGLNFELFTNRKNLQLQGREIRALYEDRQGSLWIGSLSGGLTRYRDGNFFNYPVAEHKNLYMISAIEEDRWGNLWIGSLQKGLTCFGDGKFTTYTTTDGLPSNEVKSISKDASGDLWVVTIAGIVKLLKPGNFTVCVSPEVLPAYKTACFYQEETAVLWIGTGGHGLFRRTEEGFTSYMTEAGVTHPVITCLYQDSMKYIWIGTDGGGLARLSNGMFDTLPGGDMLADGSISSIYEDREGSLWVGTLDGGLHQFRDGKFTTFTASEGLVHDYVYCIHEDRAGNLWIGTRGGLSIIKRSRKSKRRLTAALADIGVAVNNPVLSIYEDQSGHLWIGTWGDGLHRFKNGTLTTLTKKSGLSDDRINCIIGDRLGNIWIGTLNGLNRFNSRSAILTVFNTKDGLSDNFIKFIFEDSRGDLWIGTDTGLNLFRDGVFTTRSLKSDIEDNFFRCIYEDSGRTLWFGTRSGLARLEEGDIAPVWYTVDSGLIDNQVYSIIEDEREYLWLAGRNGISRISKKELEDYSHGKIDQIRPDSYNEKDGMRSRWSTGVVCRTRDGRLWFPTSVGAAVIDPNYIRKNELPPPLHIEKIVVDGESIPLHSAAGGEETLVLAPGKKRLEFYYTAVSFINPRKIRFKLKLEGYDRDWIDVGTSRYTTYTGLPPGKYTLKVNACNSDGVRNRSGTSFSFYMKPHWYSTWWASSIFILTALLGLLAFVKFRSIKLEKEKHRLERIVEDRTEEVNQKNLLLNEKNRELLETQEKLESAARTDPLTNLSNRRDILEKIEAEKIRADRQKKPFSLILCDIDNFKTFNDKYGHDCGDFVLVSAAESMRSLLRKQDCVARWGGEEFLLLLPETGLEGGRVLAEKLREHIAGHTLKYKGVSLSITMTMGVAAYAYSSSRSIADFIKAVDNAMYEGKRSGKNRVVAAR